MTKRPRDESAILREWVTCSEVTAISKKACLKYVVSLPPTNRGSKTTFFRRIRNLRANLTAYILGMTHDVHKRASASQTARGLLHRVETTRTLVHKRLQIGCEFSPTLRKFCITLPGFADGDQQTELNQTLPNGGR